LLAILRHIIVGIIDFFHRPFTRWIPTQTFRYLACGGSNAVLNSVLYSISLNHIFHKQNFHVWGTYNITDRVAAYIVAFCISFPIGFSLSRYIVFPESTLHGRIQLFRYIVTTVGFIIVTYLLIKFFDDNSFLHMIPPTISYIFIIIIVSVMSYVLQRTYTFKTRTEVAGDTNGQSV
jgi:putative flippase GtrA